MADPESPRVTRRNIEGQSGFILVDAQWDADSARDQFAHMPMHTGPLTGRFRTEPADQVMARRRADGSPPV